MRAVDLDVSPGRPYPLGATYDGIGTNFSIFSEVADHVEVCLFDARGREVRRRLPEETGAHPPRLHLRHRARAALRLPGPRPVAAGSRALRCNSDKLLLDPYGKAVEGEVRWNRSLFGHQHADESRASSRADSAASMPKNVVISPFFDWGNDRPPETPWHMTVVYEMHVKGFTARHPDVPPELRGTYAGLAVPPVIEHLLSLGVTAVELQPVHQFIHDQHARRAGAAELLGLQLDLLPRPAQRVLGERRARPAGPGVQAAREDAARRRHRGAARRRLQPHRRGQPSRSDAVVQGDRQPRLLPARPGRPALLRRLHRHRATPSTSGTPTSSSS